jgi:hypothetical protein
MLEPILDILRRVPVKEFRHPVIVTSIWLYNHTEIWLE